MLGDYVERIYSIGLKMKDTTDAAFASHFDLHLEIALMDDWKQKLTTKETIHLPNILSFIIMYSNI